MPQWDRITIPVTLRTRLAEQVVGEVTGLLAAAKLVTEELAAVPPRAPARTQPTALATDSQRRLPQAVQAAMAASVS